MPRYAEPPEQMTPFAKLLVNYMWNERPPNRPPLSPHQVAIRIGASQQNLSNWIFRSSLPPFETIMEVLARLDIPLRALYDAYMSAGIPMPRWDADDPNKPSVSPGKPATMRTTRKPVTVPSDLTMTTPAPLPYTPPPPPPDEATDWDLLVAQTEQALREEGAPDAMIEAVIGHIRAQQAGTGSPIQRSLIAEHTETTQASDDEPTHDDPASSLPPGRPARSGRAHKESAGE